MLRKGSKVPRLGHSHRLSISWREGHSVRGRVWAGTSEALTFNLCGDSQGSLTSTWGNVPFYQTHLIFFLEVQNIPSSLVLKMRWGQTESVLISVAGD